MSERGGGFAALLFLAHLAGLSGCAVQPAEDAALRQLADYSRYVVVTIRNEPAPPPPRAGASVRTYPGVASYAVAPAARNTARAIAAAHGLRESAAWPIGLLGVHCIVLETPAGADPAATVARLRRDPRVESVQPMQSFSTLTAPPPAVADPYRMLQHNLDVMEVDAAHRWSRGAGVRIGVVDTGVDATHPDLSGRIVRQRNLVGDGAGADPPDRHGTAIAGIMGAASGNQEGIVGVAPGAKLYVLRACWPRADDEARAQCSSFTLAKALAAAVEARLDIVNLSLAGPADPLLTRIVEAGLERGVVFVGATPPGDPLHRFPTNIRGVIAVNSSGEESVEDATVFAPVSAPGRDVLTLVPGGRYDFQSGSSLAAASVSGGIALLLSRDRTLDARNLHDLLTRSMRPIASAAGGEALSVNLCAALAQLAPEAVCTDQLETTGRPTGDRLRATGGSE